MSVNLVDHMGSTVPVRRDGNVVHVDGFCQHDTQTTIDSVRFKKGADIRVGDEVFSDNLMSWHKVYRVYTETQDGIDYTIASV